jgi:hypothetical protein
MDRAVLCLLRDSGQTASLLAILSRVKFAPPFAPKRFTFIEGRKPRESARSRCSSKV